MRPSDLREILNVPYSEEQLDAASAPLAPGVIIAGAGTGKTSVMAARVVWLIANGLVQPDQILGLTFTRKATGELLNRVREAIDATIASGAYVVERPETVEAEVDGPGDPTIMTYNAFAASVLTENAILLGMEPDAQLLSDTARNQRAYRVVCNAPTMIEDISRPASAASAVMQLDETLASLDVSPEALIVHDTKLLADLQARGGTQNIVGKIADAARKRIAYAQLVAEFRAAKLVNDEYDYSDQIRLALELAGAFPNIGAGLRERFKVVLLDEYQDSSIAQRRLMLALFGGGHPVTAVGDPLQSIYEWRGASTANIMNFPRHFLDSDGQPAQQLGLKINRRSAPRIIELANELAPDLRDEYRVEPLEAGALSKGSGDVTCAMFATSEEEAEFIADDIARRGAFEETAVMCRTAAGLQSVYAALTARGVPAQLVGTAALLATPEAQAVRSMLEAVHDPVANPAMIHILTGPRYRIGERDLTILGARARDLAQVKSTLGATTTVDEALAEAVDGIDDAEVVSISDAVLDLGDAERFPFSLQARERLTQLAAELRMLRRHLAEPLPDFVRRVMMTIGLHVETEATPHRVASTSREALDAFAALANDFVDLDGYSSLGSFLRRLRDADRFDANVDMEPPAPTKAVTLMTLHKSKGLEYAHVYVPQVVKGAFPNGQGASRWPTSAKVVPWSLRDDAPLELLGWPHFESTLSDKDSKEWVARSQRLEKLEELRLLYVAVTRAERSIMFSGYRIDSSSGASKDESEYLLAIKDACLAGIGEVVCWHDEPDVFDVIAASRENADAENVRKSAESVQSLRGTITQLPEPVSDRVAQWDSDAEVIAAQAQLERHDVISVSLPERMSTSEVVRLADDPDAFALDLARPMPRKPSLAARRGTALHAAIEQYYQQAPLLVPEDLPGSADSEIASEVELAAFKDAFRATTYAERTPVAIEAPFALVIAGRVVPGRIDAVFANDNGTFDVVDWKTGGPASAHALQLAVYRLAWSELQGVPLDHVGAAFVMLRTGEVIRPQGLADRAELERLLG